MTTESTTYALARISYPPHDDPDQPRLTWGVYNLKTQKLLAKPGHSRSLRWALGEVNQRTAAYEARLAGQPFTHQVIALEADHDGAAKRMVGHYGTLVVTLDLWERHLKRAALVDDLAEIALDAHQRFVQRLRRNRDASSPAVAQALTALTYTARALRDEAAALADAVLTPAPTPAPNCAGLTEAQT